MSYGLNIYNNSNYLQIDESYSNCTLYQSGTAVTGTTVSVPGTPKVPAPLTKAMIFVRIPYGTCIALYGTRSSTSFTAKPGVYGQANFTYEYRIFRIASSLNPTTGYGMQVFNSSGNLSFDSGYTYARIQLQLQLTVNSIYSGGTIPNQGFQPWIYLDPLVISGAVPLDANIAQLYVLSATQNPDNSVSFYQTYIQPVAPNQNFSLPGTRTMLLAK